MEHQIDNIESEYSIGTLKHATRRLRPIVERFTHAHKLSPLPRKDESHLHIASILIYFSAKLHEISQTGAGTKRYSPATPTLKQKNNITTPLSSITLRHEKRLAL